jgi:hypothetical protein
MNLEIWDGTPSNNWWESYKTSVVEVRQDTKGDTDKTINQSPENLRETIAWNPLLSDVFFVNNEWIIQVKLEIEGSEILKSHFEWIPIVPGVILRTLFENIAWIYQNFSKTDFLGVVKPWDELHIVENGIEVWGKLILSYSQERVEKKVFNVWPIISKKLNEEDADNLILQKPPFRFITECFVFNSKKWEISIWDEISWFFIIPNNFSFNNSPEIYDEIVAQILSLWASNILNWEKSNEEKDFKILTFIHSQINNLVKSPLIPWDKLTCKAKVIESWKNNVWVEFELYNNWVLIQFWIIKWNKMLKKILNRIK